MMSQGMPLGLKRIALDVKLRRRKKGQDVVRQGMRTGFRGRGSDRHLWTIEKVVNDGNLEVLLEMRESPEMH